MLHDGLTAEEWNLGIESMGLILHNLWPEMPDLSVSEYAENYRSLPLGTPFPGPWDNDRTPYLREMMDDMGPQSIIQEEYCLKGHQIGFTAAAENIILYWMDLNPTTILYVSATDDLLKDWVNKRLEAAIDSVGMRHKMHGGGENKHTRRSGDNTFSKEFLGGDLKMASAQSAAGLRSMSRRILILDEMDGAPAQLRTGEGTYVKVAAARTTSFGNRKKILGFSTPTTYDASLIWQKYELGDCRKYLVPCPHCKKPQELVLQTGDMRHGLHGETKAGKFETAYYLCEFCGEAIFDHQKVGMLAGGRWEPTKESCYKTYRSRHISGLYSPPGMLSWDDFYKEYMDAQLTPDGMRSFTNLYLGLPYRETGARPSMQIVQSLRGDYQEFTVPDGVLYLTAGIDVQAGSAKDPDHPARLEMHVVGHGLGYRRWSIGYYVFPGSTDNAFEGAWQKLVEWFGQGKGVYHRSALSNLSDVAFPISLIFIDSGNNPQVTYQFCTRGPGMFPIKGMPLHAMIADAKRREAGQAPGGYIYYRYARVSDGQMIYELNVSLYKHGIYADLSRSGAANRIPGTIQRTSFFDFPQNYADDFFKGLASEEELPDGSYRQISAYNEPLDTTVYAVAAAHVYLDGLVTMARDAARKQGANPSQLQQIGARQALDYLAARIGSPVEAPRAPDSSQEEK
jgi:phage terminase large subunit GpA-like protein